MKSHCLAKITLRLLLVVLLQAKETHAILRFCSFTQDRCFFFLGSIMHSGEPGTSDCRESCQIFPFFMLQLECGTCGDGFRPTAPNAPTPTPPTPTPPTPTPPTDDSGYDVGFSVQGDDGPEFAQAAARWAEVIVGDIPPTRNVPPALSGCSMPTVVDDIFICARIAPNDGPGGVLGAAGPRARVGNYAVSGLMEFDSADVDNLRRRGTFEDVILHEMGHVIGIGTLWNLLDIVGSDRDGCPYNGSNSGNANREYRELSGCSGTIPTEQDGGQGTACGHFDDGCFGTELMTGFVSGSTNPLSRLTVATLEDMFHTVNYDAADSYSRNNLDSSCRCNRRLNEEESVPERKLQKEPISPELLERAIAYGKEILFVDNLLNMQRDQEDSEIEMLSSIVVFVEENGVFRDIHVTL